MKFKDFKYKSFFPMTIILIGGLLSVLGAFIAARHAMRDSAKLNEKNEQIIKLTEENARLSKEALENITGGKTWAFIKSGLDTTLNGIINQPSLWTINVVGKTPIYDVNVTIYKLNRIKGENNPIEMEQFLNIDLGTITPSLYPKNIGQISFPKYDRKVEYLVRINARNGEITQHIILLKINKDYWKKAERVVRFLPTESDGFKIEILMENIGENFPESDIKWVEF